MQKFRAPVTITLESMQVELKKASEQPGSRPTYNAIESFPSPYAHTLTLSQNNQAVILQGRNYPREKDQEDRFFIAELATLEAWLPRQIGQLLEHSVKWTGEQLENYYDGAVFAGSIIDKNAIYTAGLGDCRALLAQITENGAATYQRLNVEHHINVQSEQQRILKEKGTLQKGSNGVLRLNGILLPTRSFGDKPASQYGGLGVEPSISYYQVSSNSNTKSYLIISSDGLSDGVTPKEIATCLENIEKCNNNIHAQVQRNPKKSSSKASTINPVLSVNTAQMLYRKAKKNGSSDDITFLMTTVPAQDSYPILAGVVDGHGGDEVSKLTRKLFPKNLQWRITQSNALIAPLQHYIQQNNSKINEALYRLHEQLLDLALTELQQNHLTEDDNEDELKNNFVYRLACLIVEKLKQGYQLETIKGFIDYANKAIKHIQDKLTTLWQTREGEYLRPAFLQLRDKAITTLLTAFPDQPKFNFSFSKELGQLQEWHKQIQPLLQPLLSAIEQRINAQQSFEIYLEKFRLCRQQQKLLTLLNQILAVEHREGKTPQEIKAGHTLAGKILLFIQRLHSSDTVYLSLEPKIHELLALLKPLKEKSETSSNPTLADKYKQLIINLDFDGFMKDKEDPLWRYTDMLEILITQMTDMDEHTLAQLNLSFISNKLTALRKGLGALPALKPFIQRTLGHLLREQAIILLAQGKDPAEADSFSQIYSYIDKNTLAWKNFLKETFPKNPIHSELINIKLAKLRRQLIKEIVASQTSWPKQSSEEGLQEAFETAKQGVTWKTIDSIIRTAFIVTRIIQKHCTDIPKILEEKTEFQDWYNELVEDTLLKVIQENSPGRILHELLADRLARFEQVVKITNFEEQTVDVFIDLLNWPLTEKQHLVQLLKLIIERNPTSLDKNDISSLENLKTALENELRDKNNRSLAAFTAGRFPNKTNHSANLDYQLLKHLLQNPNLLPPPGLSGSPISTLETHFTKSCIFLRNYVADKNPLANILASEKRQKIICAFVETKVETLYRKNCLLTKKLFDEVEKKIELNTETTVNIVDRILDSNSIPISNLESFKNTALELAQVLDGVCTNNAKWLFYDLNCDGDSEEKIDSRKDLAKTARSHSIEFYQQLSQQPTEPSQLKTTSPPSRKSTFSDSLFSKLKFS